MIRLFSRHDPSLLALGTHAIRISTLMLPLVGFQIVGASYFRAVGKPKEAMLLMLSRQVLLLVPAALVLPLFFFGLDGVRAALPTSDFGASLLTGIYLLVELRELKASHRRRNRLMGRPSEPGEQSLLSAAKNLARTRHFCQDSSLCAQNDRP